MEKKYVIIDKNSGKLRIAKEPGDAEVLTPAKDAKKMIHSDWKPWAYSAGGGALAYLLADSIIGEETKKDKDESVWMRVLKKSIPYAAGAAGALGGYALSKNAADEKKNEIALEMNPDGSVSEPNMPTGDVAKGIGWGAFAGAGAAGARAAALWRYRDNLIGSRYLDAFNAQTAADQYVSALRDAVARRNIAASSAAVPGLTRRGRAQANQQSAAAEAEMMEHIRRSRRPISSAREASRVAGPEAPKAIARAGADEAYLKALQKTSLKMNPTAGTGIKGAAGRALNFLGRNVNGRLGRFLNMRGSIMSIPALTLLGTGARWIGSRQSGQRKKVMDALKQEGFEIEERD